MSLISHAFDRQVIYTFEDIHCLEDRSD